MGCWPAKWGVMGGREACRCEARSQKQRCCHETSRRQPGRLNASRLDLLLYLRLWLHLVPLGELPLRGEDSRTDERLAALFWGPLLNPCQDEAELTRRLGFRA